MQNIEQLTRELGAALQLCPEYVRFVAAKEENEADEALQENLRELDLVRMQYRREAAKGDDPAAMEDCDRRFKALYDEVIKNGHMQDYQLAGSGLDKLIKRVVGILQGCVQGEDPGSYEPEESGCGGQGSGCGGCKGCG